MDYQNPCPHTAAAIMEYYRGIDISKFSPEKDRVLTKEYNQVKANYVPAELKFIKDYSDTIAATIQEEPKRAEHIFYTSMMELYNRYTEWNKDYNPRGKPVGKTTLATRFTDHKFITRSTCRQKGNILFLSWKYNDLLEYWKSNQYEQEDIQTIDLATHESLLAQQRIQ